MQPNQQAALTARQASQYIGIETEGDALKPSRSSGTLWGLDAPRFIRAGNKKIIYLKADLDAFLDGLETFANNAQASAAAELR